MVLFIMAVKLLVWKLLALLWAKVSLTNWYVVFLEFNPGLFKNWSVLCFAILLLNGLFIIGVLM